MCIRDIVNGGLLVKGYSFSVTLPLFSFSTLKKERLGVYVCYILLYLCDNCLTYTLKAFFCCLMLSVF